MGGRLSFGVVGDASKTLKSWVPKLRDLGRRVVALEEVNISLEEYATGRFFLNQPTFGRVVDFGALPNATSKSVDHGVEDFDQMLPIMGKATDGTNQIPLPYVDTVTGNLIEMRADASEVTIVTAADYSGYSGLIFFEYTKKG